LPDFAEQSLVDSIVAQGLNPADYLVADGTSPSGYVLRNPIYTEFPGGYNPNFGADLTDFEVVLGLRGELIPHLTWDLRGRYGENEVDYTLSESINPSLGGLSPLSFRPGTLTQEESGINVDFVKSFENSPLNIAFGGEWRDETYKIAKGDDASVVAGPTAAIFGVGSDGFQGFPEEAAGDFGSESWAVYTDVETDITDRLSGAVALRYEDFDEFGDTTDWKISGRYEITENFAVRATYNTGFRAPTPGQVNTLNVTTTSDASGNLIPNGTYPVNHPVALALGSQPLEPEESDNYTVGLVWTVGASTSLTLDYYYIDIENRLALLTNTIDQDDVETLLDAGIENAELLLGSNANFFINGFDSKIQGVDFAATTAVDFAGGGLVIDFRHNYNRQEVSNVTPNTIDAARVYDLEHQIPTQRSVLTFDWDSGGIFGALLRLNYYDDWQTTAGLFNSSNPPDKFSYSSTLLVDAEVSATFNEMFTVTLGGENIFDEYPDDEQDGTLRFLGVEDALTSPFGFNGGFYYLRLSASF
jgi:iron complex outermembrane receptor protein